MKMNLLGYDALQIGKNLSDGLEELAAHIFRVCGLPP
jgi:hypothetical protein